MLAYWLEFKSLFQKNWFLIFVLISLLFFQLIYSFLFPSVGFNDNWQPVNTYLPKFTVESTDNLLLEKIYPLISSEYRLNSDVGNYLELARNFTPQYFEGHVFLNRPLYPFLIFLSSLPFSFFIAPPYSIIFGLSILLNLVLASLAVFLFFQLIKKLFSLKTAFLSSVLLISSPYFHASLIQPRAEMLIAFAVVFSVYLLYNYIKKPSAFKLIVFSLIIGSLMLGKMFYAISFFILLMALYFKRYKEGAVFFLVHLIPLGFWYLWVTQIWQIPYVSGEIRDWEMGVWILKIFSLPAGEAAKIFLGAVPNFFTALFYGFLFVPVIFSAIGFKRLPFRSRNLIFFGSIFSVFLLAFIMNIYAYRHAFLLFPIIYPAAVLGIEKAANFFGRYYRWLAPLFYIVVIGFIIIISNINIYHLFDYL